MKKQQRKRILVIIFTIVLMLSPIKVYGSEFQEPILIKGAATAYCLSGTTASGEQTRDGVCAAKKEWLGKVAIVYQRLPDDSIGKLIGIYECLDTGGTDGLKNGRVIDVWKPDLTSCQEFMNLVYEDDCKGKVYILIMESEG